MKTLRLFVTALMLGLSIAPMTSAERNDTSFRDPNETDPRLTAHDAVIPDAFLTLGDWSVIGDQPGVEFGYSVATAGDVNGDGYADVIVGAPMYDNGTDNEGAVFVFYGSPAGLSTTPDWTVGSGQKGARFGHSVGTAGDVNGDGCDDVIVGAYRYRTDGPETGRAYVFLGSKDGLSTSPDWTFDGAHSYAHLGVSVGTAGDVNGDSYTDIIVGAKLYTNGQPAEGAAYVFYGSPSGPITTTHWMVEGDQANALFGAAVGTAGDVNGDDYDDVIVGAPQHDNGETDEGAVFVFYGSDSGLSTSHDWTADSDQAEAEFGASVGTAGDTNGDDCSDIIVGAPQYNNGQVDGGGAFAFYGSPTGPSETAGWSVEGDQDAIQFGISVGTAGDVNADGYADIIVGAPHYSGDAPDGKPDEGGAFVFRGSVFGLRTIVGWSGGGNKTDTDFGFSVGTAGDVNGDGCDDVIAGAPIYRWNEKLLGLVLVHHGEKVTDPEFHTYLPLVLKASQ